MSVRYARCVVVLCLVGSGCDEEEPPEPGITPPEETGSTPSVPRITCKDPAARERQPYEREVVGDDWELAPPDEHGLRVGGQGLVVVDLDGDGFLDLFVPDLLYPSHVLLGTGDGFEPADELLSEPVLDAIGASAADADGDGDEDIVVYRFESDPLLLRNEGDGSLVVEPLEVPDDGLPGCGGSAAWGDYDLDGDLDLFLGRADRKVNKETVPCESWLLENRGDGTFDPVEGMLSDDVHQNRVIAAGWLPLDDDPWPELYVVTDKSASTPGNRVLDNDGGVLTQVDDHPLNVEIDGMGLAAGDLNGDGVLDVIVPGIGEYALLLSAPGDMWIDHANAWGLIPDDERDQHTAWGGALEDLDADGLEDYVAVYGAISADRDDYPAQPAEVHRRTTPETFTPVAATWGLDDSLSQRGFVVADLDGNGFLDLVRREFGGVVLVDRARCNAGTWLGITLRQDGPNPRAVGAEVRVLSGERSWYRLVSQGSTSYASGNPAVAHFGLGLAEQVDAIEVTWPDGETLVYDGVPTKQHIEIVR